MFAIKRVNGLFKPARFETIEQAEAAFNPTPLGDVEIVKCCAAGCDPRETETSIQAHNSGPQFPTHARKV